MTGGDIETIRSRHTNSGSNDEKFIPKTEDELLLAAMGYTQELRREYSVREVFGIAFSKIFPTRHFTPPI